MTHLRLCLAFCFFAPVMGCGGSSTDNQQDSDPGAVDTCNDICTMKSECSWASNFSVDACEAECARDDETATLEACQGRWTTLQRCEANRFACFSSSTESCESQEETYRSCLNGLAADEESMLDPVYLTAPEEPEASSSGTEACVTSCVLSNECVGISRDFQSCTESCEDFAAQSAERGCFAQYEEAWLCSLTNFDCNDFDICEEKFQALVDCL